MARKDTSHILRVEHALHDQEQAQPVEGEEASGSMAQIEESINARESKIRSERADAGLCHECGQPSKYDLCARCKEKDESRFAAFQAGGAPALAALIKQQRADLTSWGLSDITTAALLLAEREKAPRPGAQVEITIDTTKAEANLLRLTSLMRQMTEEARAGRDPFGSAEEIAKLKAELAEEKQKSADLTTQMQSQEGLIQGLELAVKGVSAVRPMAPGERPGCFMVDEATMRLWREVLERARIGLSAVLDGVDNLSNEDRGHVAYALADVIDLRNEMPETEAPAPKEAPPGFVAQHTIVLDEETLATYRELLAKKQAPAPEPKDPTYSENTPKCPYCGHVNEDGPDGDNTYFDGNDYEVECEACDKEYTAWATVDISFTSAKLEGEEEEEEPEEPKEPYHSDDPNQTVLFDEGKKNGGENV